MTARDLTPGIKFAISWLHGRAAAMNDPNAKAVLNSAAFSLGQARAAGITEILPTPLPTQEQART